MIVDAIELVADASAHTVHFGGRRMRHIIAQFLIERIAIGEGHHLGIAARRLGLLDDLERFEILLRYLRHISHFGIDRGGHDIAHRRMSRNRCDDQLRDDSGGEDRLAGLKALDGEMEAFLETLVTAAVDVDGRGSDVTDLKVGAQLGGRGGGYRSLLRAGRGYKCSQCRGSEIQPPGVNCFSRRGGSYNSWRCCRRSRARPSVWDRSAAPSGNWYR